jgi:hypothetical protein
MIANRTAFIAGERTRAIARGTAIAGDGMIAAAASIASVPVTVKTTSA